MLTTSEVTTVTGLSSRVLWAWKHQGRLTPVRQGKQWVWDLGQVEAVRRAQGQQELLRKLFRS